VSTRSREEENVPAAAVLCLRELVKTQKRKKGNQNRTFKPSGKLLENF